MLAVVAAHVDALLRHGAAAEGRLDHRFRRPDKGHDRAVRRLTGIDVEYADARHGRNGPDDGVDDSAVTPFAVIGYTLDEFFHKDFLIQVQRYKKYLSLSQQLNQ